MAFVYEFVFLLFPHLMLLVLVSGDGKNEYQRRECPSSFSCENLGNISFPFTTIERPDCGLLPIRNCADPHKYKMIQLQDKGKFFGVVRLSPFPKTSLFRDMDLYKLLESKSCEAFTYNLTLPLTSIFHLVSLHIDSSATMFRCNRTLHVSPPTYFHNYTKCPDYDLYYNPLITSNNIINASSVAALGLSSCTKVKLPIKDAPDAVDPFTFITADIFTEVKVTDECAICYYKKRGRCQLDRNQRFYCDRSKTGKMPIVAKVTMAVVGVAVLIVLGLMAYYCFRTKISLPIFLLFKKENPTHQIIEDFLKEFGHFPATRYNYSDLKKITNSFKNKLGQGGYGSVYKGKLHDGSAVAVKVLSELKGNGEDFINEVASISRTSHVNIVRLLGFCLDGSKKALIYEFMPNGSLEKFIYEDKHPLKDHCRLDCKTLYDIAVGVARGLEYLHRGCNTRILHFDIKPHNILLDGDLCPKISDFGLAKICPRKESIVSMFGARGTPGYIAPELISRDFGGVSHKSDVYSYGMMVMEMVGRRKNIKVEVDCSSELYFPHWIYKRIELNQDLGLRCIENEVDEEMIRKMTVVSLWCIQINPSKRPAMHKVVEMLEGSLHLLEIPPKPYLCSPSTSPAPTILSSEVLSFC